MNKPLPCKRCGKKLTFPDRRRVHGRITSLGLSLTDIEIVMPRCNDCATKWLQDHSCLPQIMIARCPLPIYVLRVKDDGWPELYALLTGNFVCVRETPRSMLVVSDTPVPTINETTDPIHKRSAAAMVESSILARPPKASPRFIASKAWGGQ